MTSIVFPGQGSQTAGMVKDFYDNFKTAKLIFEEIEDYTKINLKKIIFDNVDDELNLTQFTQISIFTASYTIFKVYCSEANIDSSTINVMMGHSLGEYTALACSERVTLKDCSLLLKKRGELMNNAVPPNETGMAALIGKEAKTIQNIIDKNNLNLEIANDNSNIQSVISGNINEIKKSEKLFINNGIKKFVILNVSAAFHSKYMVKAQKELSNDIENLKFKDSKIRIISNYDANVHNENIIIKQNLQNQMANRVKWTESIKKLEDIGENKIIEMGPNKILSGLIRRITKNFDMISINNISDIK